MTASTQIPSEFRTDHLFVLVGRNPLPNVVAIRLLRPENGRVYLICTEATRSHAKKIIRTTELSLHDNVELIEVDDSRGGVLASQVQRYAAGHSSIGLNYTGGTKHMVLHAFLGVQQAAQDFKIQPILSYLDARTLEMRIERLGSSSHSYDAGTAVPLTFAEILTMHDHTIESSEGEPILPEIYPALSQLDAAVLSGWFQGARKNKKLLEQRTIQLPDIPVLQPFWQGAETVGELADHLGLSMQEMSKWFAGHWLEHYTLLSIQQISESCHIHDSAMNVVIGDFEFDVVAMKGYQLFAMSCVTQGDKKTVKQKLFEAYTRAQQMGGDEARVAVICHAEPHGDSSPERIEGEIVREWDAKGKVRVFGQEHLPHLPDYLEYWINEQN